mgnify:CR=1 FL=1
MSILRKLVQNDKPLPLLVVFLIFEIAIAIFYFFRISDVVQDVFNNAYESVLIFFEFHELVALIFMIIVMAVPFNFYYMTETKFRPTTSGGYIFFVLSIAANLVVAFTEIGVTKISFDSNAGNMFAPKLSSYGEFTIWGMAVLVSITHQIITYVSIRNIILLRQEPNEESEKS